MSNSLQALTSRNWIYNLERQSASNHRNVWIILRPCSKQQRSLGPNRLMVPVRLAINDSFIILIIYVREPKPAQQQRFKTCSDPLLPIWYRSIAIEIVRPGSFAVFETYIMWRTLEAMRNGRFVLDGALPSPRGRVRIWLLKWLSRGAQWLNWWNSTHFFPNHFVRFEIGLTWWEPLQISKEVDLFRVRFQEHYSVFVSNELITFGSLFQLMVHVSLFECHFLRLQRNTRSYQTSFPLPFEVWNKRLFACQVQAYLSILQPEKRQPNERRQ